uniref:DUF6824 domain-containing protein n=1 Tax=Craspedostauros australis TaxID=1486917 RepID=A0A7R9WWU9_9STRA|mmetsp:Transcript_21403/g.59549  ORF Transcript_21403/g.59549 Transcript_21403/m.59549 type:complete len:173 (+) Transcript_21403:159-677(+)
MRTNNHSSYGGGDSSPLAANISDEFDDGSNSESDGGVAAHPMPAGEPTDLDVLLGRGRPFQNHSGNQYLRELIAEWFDTYDISPRRAKMAVAERVVHLINERSGRFLRRDRGAKGWVEVEFTEARDKVSHGFRKRREMLANEQKRAGKSTMPIQRSSKPAETAESKRMKVSM